jgi:hypothetical protein
VAPVGVANLAVVNVSGAGEAASAPAMADWALATAAHVTVGANDPVAAARESCGFRCNPLESGLADRLGKTGLVDVMVTSCAREVRFLSRSHGSGGGKHVR